MRAGPGRVLRSLLVSCIVHAARTHAERCRDAPRMRLPGRGAVADYMANCVERQRIDHGLSGTVLRPHGRPLNLQCRVLNPNVQISSS